MSTNEPDAEVAVVGGGVAGLSAAIFTARAGLRTRIVSEGEPIIKRNAHLENYPGFPAGVNPRLLFSMMQAQARRAGVWFVDGEVTAVENDGDRFEITTADGESMDATYVIAASWSDSSYLEDLDLDLIQRGSKQFVGIDDAGRTDVDGLYAAGRLAQQYHQAIVAAGHGAQVALTLLDDSDEPFYHDWTVPENYFTGRGREVPPGCEEIDDEERLRREEESIEVMSRYFTEPLDSEPIQHPDVADEE
ncbi:MAG: FAD-dependent oxidoreductase [Haloarculaceae archaeon]